MPNENPLALKMIVKLFVHIVLFIVEFVEWCWCIFEVHQNMWVC